MYINIFKTYQLLVGQLINNRSFDIRGFGAILPWFLVFLGISANGFPSTVVDNTIKYFPRQQIF